jgi:hypothetical protein
VTTGSSIDRQSNNVSLFTLVEQINLPPNSPPPPRGLIPVEIHAYFQLPEAQVNRDFELRFALRADNGLETLSDVFRHRISAPRFRVRTLGLPYPPVLGQYTLHVDVRWVGNGQGPRDEQHWQRQAAAWPIGLYQLDPRPRVTH